MQRTWATGSDHDQQPLAWLSRLDDSSTLETLRQALAVALADDATVGECQTGLLAVEAIAYLRGADADLHPHLHAWLHAKRPIVDDALRDLAMAVVARLRSDSQLANHWRVHLADRFERWQSALDGVAIRLRDARRAEDAAHPTLAEIEALGTSLEAALPHLRVALVTAQVDDPVATEVIGPGLTLVLHYELPGKEPVAVPRAHTQAWGKTPWREAAARTRAVAELRIHHIESEHHEVSVVFGSDTFTAGMAPFVDIFLDAPAPYGVLLGIPFAGGFVFHRIVDAHWRDAATDVMEHVDKLFESQEPISRELYWWRDGTLTIVPHQRVGEAILVMPSDELLAALAPLG